MKRSKGRGGHRQRRERRALFGQMVHLDGSDHEWLATQPGERQMLLLVVDDATGRNLAARLVEAETTEALPGDHAGNGRDLRRSGAALYGSA